ncbi:MAG: response regulator [Clostridiales Family XIII bacterium]|jgi:signal transduction histidine kinase/CheY-like chemotaxis protein|nr:response regulator [Clostridiales Family XIII bacterium]
MKNAYRNFLRKYILTDELSFDARVFNIVCSAGVVALTVSVIGHIIEQSAWQLMIIKAAMVISAIMLFFISNSYKAHKVGAVCAIVGFGYIMFPALFFTNGGITGGIAAYFVLTIVLIVLLSKGVALIVFVTTHIAVIITCYVVQHLKPDYVLPLNDFQRYADTVISIVIAGIFIAICVRGLSALFALEQEKATAAGKAKGDFLAQMSHEMRTPMNAIIGMITILKQEQDPVREHQGLRKIEIASSHLLGVINDILDMSKIEAGKMELSSEAFSFRQMLDDTTTVVGGLIEDKEQIFTQAVDPAVPDILLGDEKRLSQVVANLLSNANKFTAIGGRIRLQATRGEDAPDGRHRIEISVSDNGIGITEEQIGRLFTAFEQADSGTSRKFGGTGLGLAISKRIVEMMDGEISVQSTPGEGSVFSFYVLLADGVKALGGKERVILPDEANYAGKKMLIAEDIDINLEILTTLLAPTGLEITTAENGRQAVERFLEADGNFDMIFMDIQMPEMDGYDATRAIRASGLATAQTVPIIAMTANVFKEDVAQALESGMNDHLGKPVVLPDIMAKLHEYLA